MLDIFQLQVSRHGRKRSPCSRLELHHRRIRRFFWWSRYVFFHLSPERKGRTFFKKQFLSFCLLEDASEEINIYALALEQIWSPVLELRLCILPSLPQMDNKKTRLFCAGLCINIPLQASAYYTVVFWSKEIRPFCAQQNTASSMERLDCTWTSWAQCHWTLQVTLVHISRKNIVLVALKCDWWLFFKQEKRLPSRNSCILCRYC